MNTFLSRSSARALALSVLVSLIMITSSGCGLLLGSVKPVEEKAEDYRILDLTKLNPDWQRLPKSTEENPTPESTEVSDLAYQSKTTASVISINSGCRQSNQSEERDLQSFTQQLLLGISKIRDRKEQEVTLQGVPALQTTLQGEMGQEPIQLKTVVLRRQQCVYDLMYVARPENFASQEPDFTHFVESLRLK